MYTKILYIIDVFLIVMLYTAYFYEKRRGHLESIKKLYFKFLDDQKELKKQEMRDDEKLCEKYGKSYQKLLSEATIIKKYILDTGIPEPYLFIEDCVEGGYIRSRKFSVLDEFYQQRNDIADVFNKTINKAIGHYLYRRNTFLNPASWAEHLIFLPKHLIGYIGITSQGVKNISQAVYWIALAIVLMFNIGKPNIGPEEPKISANSSGVTIKIDIGDKTTTNFDGNIYLKLDKDNNITEVELNGVTQDVQTGSQIPISTSSTVGFRDLESPLEPKIKSQDDSADREE